MFKKLSTFSAFIVGLLGVLGISAANIFDDAYRGHTALAIFAVTCIMVALYAIWTMRTWQLKHYEKGYLPLASFVRYTTTDGKQIVYEVWRQIQVKHAFLSKIEYRYSWTGSKPAMLASSLQQVGNARKDAATNFDVVDVKFPSPRFYNDTETVHIRSSLDDSDEKSGTFCSMMIEYPTRMIHFRVELLHCGKPAHSGMMAVIDRRLLTAAGAGAYEQLDTVKFNLTSKSFEYLLANPEPGYNYRIRWDRPQNGRKRP